MQEQQPITPEQYLQTMVDDRDRLLMENSKLQTNYGQLSMHQSFNPSNLAELQLDLSKEKQLIEHILRGHVLRRNENGEYWDESNDPYRKIFTEAGVDKLMNFINFYLSLNTILSYYTDEELPEEMKVIADELADLFYLEYEHLFYRPKPKEVFATSKYNHIKLHELTDKELATLCRQVKFECDTIYAKNQREIYMIHNMLVNAVHSAYRRALWGKERDSLRKMMHISESNSPNMPGISPNQKGKSWNPLTW